MNAFIEVFTSGDMSKVATFSVSFIVLSFVLLTVLIVAKRFGITLTIKNKDGSGFDNNAHQQNHNNTNNKELEKKHTSLDEKPLTKKDLEEILKQNKSLPITDENMINGFKELEKNPEEIKKSISQIDNKSKQTWESLQTIQLTKKIEEKDIIINSLEKENNKLKSQLIDLNKELIEYKVIDDPVLIEYRNIQPKLKDGFSKIIKKICLDQKLKQISNNEEVIKYSKSRLRFVLINMGKVVIHSLSVDSEIFENETKFADLMESNNSNLFENFLDFIKKISSIGISTESLLKERREEIDKKILAAYQGILLKKWNNTLNPKNPNSIEIIKKIRASFQYYYDNYWNFEEIHDLVYSIGTQMIVTYEQVKSESLDKQILISEQIYNIIDKTISLYLRKSVLSKAKKEKNNYEETSLAHNIFKSNKK